MKKIFFIINILLATNSWSQEICQTLFLDESGMPKVSTSEEVAIPLTQDLVMKGFNGVCAIEGHKVSGLVSCENVLKEEDSFRCDSMNGQSFLLNQDGFPKNQVLLLSSSSGASLMDLSIRRSVPMGKKLVKWPLFGAMELKLAGERVAISPNQSKIEVRFLDSRESKRSCKSLLLSENDLICDSEVIYQY